MENPGQMDRFFLTAWLNRNGYTLQEIVELIKQAGWSDYDERITSEQVHFICTRVEGGYRYPRCRKIRDQYGLCDKSCRW